MNLSLASNIGRIATKGFQKDTNMVSALILLVKVGEI